MPLAANIGYLQRFCKFDPQQEVTVKIPKRTVGQAEVRNVIGVLPGSDNYAFAEKGVVAHSFSAGSLHDDYHQPGDEWEKLELRHMTTVIQGLFVGSLPIANGEATPRSKSSNGP